MLPALLRPAPESEPPKSLQRRVDRGELGVELRAQSVDRGDDRQRNTARDQAVFDGGGAALVLDEAMDQLHGKIPCCIWQRSSRASLFVAVGYSVPVIAGRLLRNG